MTTGKIPWGRLAAEGLLIVGSVYLAIVLEGNSQDRARGREATSDPAAIATLGGRFEYLRGWNLYYLDLLDEYQVELGGLITAVDEHLQKRAWEG